MKKILNVFILVLLATSFYPDIAVAQRKNDSKEIVLEFKKGTKLPQVFKSLEKQTKYKIMFITEEVDKYEFQGTIRAKDIHGAIQQVIQGKPLNFQVDRQFVTITARAAKQTTSTPPPRAYQIGGKGSG